MVHYDHAFPGLIRELPDQAPWGDANESFDDGSRHMCIPSALCRGRAERVLS